MNEVEKMYENAGIVPDCEHGECGLDYCPNNYGCGYAFYPPFTAEKQLELIKILTKKNAIGQSLPLSDLYMFYFECRHCPRVYMTFEEAIAECINYLWQDLTDAEKQQVKGILE